MHFFIFCSFPQLLYFGPCLVEEVASNGWTHRSPDRTHDHHRGQRCQPAGPAGALRCIIVHSYNFISLLRKETQKKVRLSEHLEVNLCFESLLSLGTCGHLHWSFHDERRGGLDVLAGWRSLRRHGHPQLGGHWWGHCPLGCCRYMQILTCPVKVSILWFWNSMNRIYYTKTHNTCESTYKNSQRPSYIASLTIPANPPNVHRCLRFVQCFKANSRWRQWTTLCRQRC